MKIVKEFVLRTMADEFILIPTGKTTEEFNGMITLSETGAFIWERLSSAASLDEIVDALIMEFDVDRDTALSDSKQFVEKLISLKIAEPTNPSNNW